jgi:hypothetical protein
VTVTVTSITPAPRWWIDSKVACDRSNLRPVHSAGPQSVTVASTNAPAGPVILTRVPHFSSRLASVSSAGSKTVPHAVRRPANPGPYHDAFPD